MPARSMGWVSATGIAAAGFSLIELLTVLAVMGVMAAILTKAVSGPFGSSTRRAAGREVTAYLYRARAIAIQQSRPTRLVRTGNGLKILVDSSDILLQLGSVQDLGNAYGVTLSASPTDTIKFDPRGFAVATAQTQKIMVRRGSAVDTLCVTGLGRIAARKCS
ncbi:MAG TPA: GspH/FimT family pseudopilin [Gemmatimonadales bacterium]|nr:GspH/FimT family pseudopilin [Gemmatimonadales bacterium]